jgi:hypothetical protein
MDDIELRKIIGIDALKLVGFHINIVNKNRFNEAEREKIIEVEYRRMPHEISGIRINNDRLFKSLRWEKTIASDKTFEQSVLELTVSKDGNNLNSMLVGEVVTRLFAINQHLTNDMGLELCTDGFKVNSIEINTNLRAPKHFEELLPLYRKLLVNIPYFNKAYKESGKLIKLTNREIDSSPTAFECYKKGKTIKGSIICYDKSEDLRRKKCINLNDNVVRFELKAERNRTVKRIYGTADWNDFTDERIYYAYFTNVVEPIHNYLNNIYTPNCLSLGRKLITKYRSKKNTWMFSMIKEIEQLNQKYIPVILDWQDLLPALKEFDTYRHYNRAKEKLGVAAIDTTIGHEFRTSLEVLLKQLEEIYNNGIVNNDIQIIK